FVVEHADGAEVAEQRGLDPVLLGNEGRDLKLHGADRIGLAAQRLVEAPRQVARADAGRLEAAEVVAALVEPVVDPDALGAEAGDVAGGAGQAELKVLVEAVVPGAVELGPQVV